MFHSLLVSHASQETFVLVEYPRKLQGVIPDRLGPLTKLKDRRYGRTFLVLFGPDA